MKSLIVYCSTHGTTSKAAHVLRKQIEGDVVVINLQRTQLHSDLDGFLEVQLTLFTTNLSKKFILEKMNSPPNKPFAMAFSLNL